MEWDDHMRFFQVKILDNFMLKNAKTIVYLLNIKVNFYLVFSTDMVNQVVM